MKFRVFILSVILVCCIMSAIGLAQNKVVVIPLTETVETPLEPYAPLAAASPPDSAYAIGTYAVHDMVTGLYWQKEDDNTTRSWYDAWNYCQGLSLALGSGPYYFNLTDWRLPSVAELVSIVDFETYNPAINGIAFPGTSLMFYWSATTRPNDSGKAFSVTFGGNGSATHSDKPNTHYVRCVRGLFARDNTFINSGNGTVTDLATKLTWQRQDDNLRKEWTVAVSYCQALILGGKTDWRLPTIKELHSIVDYRINNPAIDANAFPGTDSSRYWSATTDAADSSDARNVYFGGGGIYENDKLDTRYVRCVRRLSDPYRL